METYHGHVKTPHDAIILFEACRLGHLPRVQRRLSEKERQNIKSGSVFVWDEREAGMRRWTDGKSWSASRVSGSFLTYREMEGKRGGGNTFAPPMTSYGRKSPNGDSDSDHGMDMGDGPDGYRYKPDGLMKQSFSITTATHQKLHLISYYSRSHPTSANLLTPSTDPSLKHIQPARGMYPESTVHEQQNVPNVTRTIMNQPYTSQYSHSSIAAQYRPTSATHPHSYTPQPSTLSPYNGYITPTHTPPGNPATVTAHFPQPQLPPPSISSSNGAPLPYDRQNYSTHGPSMIHVEQPTQQISHVPTPLIHIRASQQSSPRMSQEAQLYRPTSNPPPLEISSSISYGSPGSSSHTSARTPPRTVDSWEINPIRASPEGSNVCIAPGEASPGKTKILEVQDIPNDRIRARDQDDINTLRKLDKSFAL